LFRLFEFQGFLSFGTVIKQRRETRLFEFQAGRIVASKVQMALSN